MHTMHTPASCVWQDRTTRTGMGKSQILSTYISNYQYIKQKIEHTRARTCAPLMPPVREATAL